MIRKIFLLLLPCTFCAGQSILTAPDVSVPSTSGVSAVPTMKIPGATKVLAPSEVLAAPDEASRMGGSGASSFRAVGPVISDSAFQEFAEDAAGHSLPVYGRALFESVPSTFAPMSDVPVPADYVIGPGDELLIRVWGKIDLDSRVTVDRNGQIFLPNVGTLNVAGLRYEQLEKFLRSSVGALYRDFELNVTLGQLRSIEVFVLGNARQPGMYTVSALSTFVDALFASGGPSGMGTMRRIELRRGGKVLSEFDIYDLLQKGDKSNDLPLLPGDVIYIPPVGPQVAIAGSVNLPGIYELKGDTALQSALACAGGLTPLAGTSRVLLERIENHTARVADEFPLDSSGLHRTLANGDLVRIFPLSPQFGNTVLLKGNLAQPGRYVWHKGMRVSDLIQSRDALITRAYWNRQNHLIANRDQSFANPPPETARSFMEDAAPDEKPPQRNGAAATDRDVRIESSRLNPADPAEAHSRGLPDVSGETGEPSAAPETGALASVAQNNAEINWDYAVIERLDSRDLSTHLITFNLGNALEIPGSSDDQTLFAGDVITIFSRKDLPLPIEKHARYARVSGEVNAPGIYRIEPGETLRTLVERAGGLTPESYLYASQLTRVSTRLAQEQQLRESVQQMQRELASRYANAPSVAPQTTADQQVQFGMQEAIIARLSAVRPAGRVVLGMRPDLHGVSAIPNFQLEDGDSYYIPPRPDTIQVTGAVYNQSAFRYQPDKTLGAYLHDAGNTTREADVKRVFLIRADGTIVNRNDRNRFWRGDFASIRLLPGDAIVVPVRIKGPGGLSGILGLTQVLSQTALTAAALSVIQQ